MDAFFAAVEERDNPRLQGLPIAVGSDPLEGHGRGVVSTANYKAREYGIRSALPISKAWQLSEQARRAGQAPVVFVDVHMEKYAAVSERIMAIVSQYAAKIEQASVDEAYFDLSPLGSFAEAQRICQRLKNEIKEKEKLTASVGLGPNKLIAKIASDMHKPDGLTVVETAKAEAFLEPLSIRKIPGIGPKTESFLNAQGIKIVQDLKKYTLAELEAMLGSPRTNFAQAKAKISTEGAGAKLVRGKWGADLFAKARGLDDAEVSDEHEIKSVGEQETFLEDSLDFSFVFPRMENLCAGVLRRLKESGFKKFRTVVITVRFAGFETKTRSHSVPKPIGTLKELKGEGMKLLMPFFDARENPHKKKIRLIGLRVEKLT